jgi:Ca2+-binding RTX toxin-like protein
MTPRAVFLIVILAALVPSANAGAATTPPLCRFRADTGRVHVFLPGQPVDDDLPVVLARAGDAIVVDGTACGDATVRNTDSIHVSGDEQPLGWGHQFEIDLRGGAFAPGRTDEGDGSSEIEMRVDTGPSAGDRVTIRGGPGPDVLVIRGSALNLDAAPDEEPDVRLLGLDDWYAEDDNLGPYDLLQVRSKGGPDRVIVADPRESRPFFDLLVTGGAGADVLASSLARVRGGRGDDELTDTARAGLWGGHGDDRLVAADPVTRGDLSRLSGGDGNDVLLGGPNEDLLIGGAGTDTLAGFRGPDYLGGGTGSDRLAGGRRQDRLDGEDGNDRLRGGGGGDRLYGGRGRDRCDADPKDIFVSGCAGPPLPG